MRCTSWLRVKLSLPFTLTVGPNLLAAGVSATLAAKLGAGLMRGALERFVVSLVFVLIALVASRPLGFRLQRYTTLAEVGDRAVAEIRPLGAGQASVYRVVFK